MDRDLKLGGSVSGFFGGGVYFLASESVDCGRRTGNERRWETCGVGRSVGEVKQVRSSGARGARKGERAVEEV